MSTRSCVVLTAALLCAGLPAWSQTLPDGPGKEIAEANCNICHTLLSRVGSGYTPQGWTTVLRMMHNQGASLPADQVEPLKAYLVKAFPEKGKPNGAVIPGPVKISFKEWQAPTPGSRPHDPLARARRLALVHRAAGQRARPRRPCDRRDQGISPQDRAFRTARAGGR